MIAARGRTIAPLALAVLSLSGCSSLWECTDTTAERGAAGVSVEVEDIYGQLLGVTAAVVDWRLEPHPQTPSEGNQVHFRYRFAGADETSDVADDACAVDKERVVLGCETVYAAEAFGPSGDPTGDAWLDIERPGKVTGVPLIPNEQDVKDGGGAHPPEPPSRGERL